MTLFNRKKNREAKSDASQALKSTLARDVFTPSVPAAISFVGREREMKDLVQYGLNVPGTQVLIWGESGAGKSTLINRALASVDRGSVATPCTPGFSYEQILGSAFAGTGAFYVAETQDRDESRTSRTAGLGGDLLGIQAHSGGESVRGGETTRLPISLPQLTPQRLLEELGVRDLSWVIEDFHKVDPPVRAEIAHALKVFADQGSKYPKTTVILLGVSESVDELVVGRANLATRLVDIEVPPLSNDELSKILEVGQDLLNIDFSSVRDRLLHTSVNTASITHALALACCNQRGIERTSTETVQFTDDDFVEAMNGYVRTRSSSLKSRFQDALLVKRKRTYDNPRILLKAMAKLPEGGVSVGDLLELVRKEHPDYPSGNASVYLRELQTPTRGSVIRRSAVGGYRFDEPLVHAYARAFFGISISEQIPDESKTAAGIVEWEHALGASAYVLNMFFSSAQAGNES